MVHVSSITALSIPNLIHEATIFLKEKLNIS